MPSDAAEQRPNGRAARTEDDRRQVAAYVAALASELRELARRHRLATLAYLMDIARLEAEAAARSEPLGAQPATAEEGP
jgi:glutamate synthase domain-containing protein 2